MFHRNQQIGGAINSGPVNIIRRGTITYFSINFSQHERFNNFHNENFVDNFLSSVKDVFVPATRGNEYKIQAYFELKNYHRTETVDLGNTKV